MQYTKMLLILSLITMISAQDCNNPLLQRFEIIQRFNTSNILTTPAISNASSTDPCAYLNGSKVCVSDAGSAAHIKWLAAYKAQFAADGTSRTAVRYTGLAYNASKYPINTCNAINSIAGQLYLKAQASTTTSTNSSNSTNSTNSTSSSNYTSFISGLKDSVNNGTLKLSNKATTSGANVTALIAQFVVDKANCVKQAMKHLIQTSCAAMSANYSTFLSGSSSTPSLKVKHASCLIFSSACKNYYVGMKRIEELLKVYSSCTATDQLLAYSTIMNGTDITVQTNTLTNLSARILAGNSTITGSLLSGSTFTTIGNTTYGGITCDSDNSADDCDFLCNYAINASSIKEWAIQNLNTASTNRRQLATSDSTITFDETNGLSPDVNIADGAAVPNNETAPADVTSPNTYVPGGSNNNTYITSDGAALRVYLAVLMTVLTAVLLA